MTDPCLELLDVAVRDLGGQQRPGQQQMAQAVSGAFDRGEVLLVQAGTGTGKSLAYLVPVFAHLTGADDVRAVIATSTLALQAQLVDRDLPRLRDAVADHLDGPVTFAALKGRSNYLCLARMHDGAADSDQLEIGEGGALSAQARAVRSWADTTEAGDRDELDDVSAVVWRAFSVNAQECARGSGCEYVADCFAERALSAARAADVVVTNHAMLALSIAQEGILPEHELLVVDEAHALAGAVQRAVTAEVSGEALQRAGRRVRAAGAVEESERLLDAADAFESSLVAHVGDEGRRIATLPSGVVEALLAVRDATSVAAGELRRGTDADPAARQRALGAVMEMSEAAGALLESGEQSVVWRRGSRLVCMPLDVSQVVRESILADHGSVLTSATLSLGGTFDAVASDVGLNPADQGWTGIDVGSPFDYARQGILYVADTLAPPGPGWPTDEALNTAADLVRSAGGRSLVLMASWAGVDAMAAALDNSLDVPILVQRRGEPTRPLIREFAAVPRTVLVGTLGLWQGVDVPGAACTLVIIDKVPFPPPSDPVVSARQAAIDAAGGSGWRSVSLPLAAASLAQGAGRLIRSSDDRGVVAVLDSRLARKRYGAYLRSSLPAFSFMTDLDKVRQALQRLDQSLGTAGG